MATSNEVLRETENIDSTIKDKPNQTREIGFTWWTTWAWLGLIVGNLYVIGNFQNQMDVALIIVMINTVNMVLILQMNKYAFLVATVISFNPILWIINGIYLKNRWDHPKVNKGVKPEGMMSEIRDDDENINDFIGFLKNNHSSTAIESQLKDLQEKGYDFKKIIDVVRNKLGDSYVVKVKRVI